MNFEQIPAPVPQNTPVHTVDTEEMEVAATRIKVLGVGGGGCNAVNSMIAADVRGVDYIAVNTDYPVLASSNASRKLVLGKKLTRGQGAGGDPTVGKQAAEESSAEIEDALKNTEMLFILTGMGGGTGTGAAPVIARIAKNMKLLTVAIVTLPFSFEGKKRNEIALAGVEELRDQVDALIIVSNDRLRKVDQKMSLQQAFSLADHILMSGVRAISDLINVQGHINLDFADVCTIIQNSGLAHMGMGVATGENRASAAAEAAMQSPLLATAMAGAKRLLVNITATPDIGLDEVEAATSIITEKAEPDARIIWGVVFDESMGDELSITVIATGFDETAPATPIAPPPAPPTSEPRTSSQAVRETFADLAEMIQ